LGKPLDTRSDLFSFGALLYEMATGAAPFAGQSSAAIFDAILHGTPVSPTRLNARVPGQLERIILRCLQKDRSVRYQHASEIRGDLERLRHASGERAFRRSGLVLAGTAVIGLLMLIYPMMRAPSPPRVSGYVQISSDGEGKGGVMGAMVTDGARLYLQEGGGTTTVVAQVPTAGGKTTVLPTSLEAPRSSISLRCGQNFWSLTSTTGWAADLSGSCPCPPARPPPRKCIGNGRRLVTGWARDCVCDRSRLVSGKPQRKWQEADDPSGTAFWLRWSPDGRRLRFTLGNVVDRTGPLAIWEVSADGTGLHPLLSGWNQRPAECCGNWTPDGRYFTFQATRQEKTEIWAMQERSGVWGAFPEIVGMPVQITAGQVNSLAPVLSPDGRKLYVIGQQMRGELTRYDAKSRQWVS
jgi:hypothetical protein